MFRIGDDLDGRWDRDLFNGLDLRDVDVRVHGIEPCAVVDVGAIATRRFQTARIPDPIQDANATSPRIPRPIPWWMIMVLIEICICICVCVYIGIDLYLLLSSWRTSKHQLVENEGTQKRMQQYCCLKPHRFLSPRLEPL